MNDGKVFLTCNVLTDTEQALGGKMNTCGTRRIPNDTYMSNGSSKSERLQHMKVNVWSKVTVDRILVHSLVKDTDERWESLPDM